MEAQTLLEIGREGLWVLIKISAPVMLVALIVGLVISLFQALTQVQEMTLSFVPKILAIFFSLLLFLPFIGAELSAYMDVIAEAIRQSGHIAAP